MSDIYLRMEYEPEEVCLELDGPPIPGKTGNGIASTILNPDYTLTIEFTDGTSYTTPSIRGAEGNGITGVEMNADYTITITLGDGSSYTTPPVRGEKGERGVSVTGFEQTGQSGLEKTYTFTLSNGESFSFTVTDGSQGDPGYSPTVTISAITGGHRVTITDEQGEHPFDVLNGEKGDKGTSISGASFNPNTYTLTLNFDDGTSFTTPSLRGATGNGIASIAKTSTVDLVDTYTVSYTDGNTFSYTVTNGAKGDTYELTNQDKQEIANLVADMNVVNVTGTDVTITGEPNTQYLCGTLSTLSITPPSSGLIDVIFTSGTSATILTLPSTVKMPEWFDVNALETNRVYEISIKNGVYGLVTSWPL